MMMFLLGLATGGIGAVGVTCLLLLLRSEDDVSHDAAERAH